eukprot:g1261.t1
MASVVPENAGGLKLDSDPNFEGPTKSRHCTDILFATILICVWVGMTILGLIGTGAITGFCSDGLGPGEPRRLFNGIDYTGNVCGISNDKLPCTNSTAATAAGARDNSNLTYAYAPNANNPNFVLCMYACPATYADQVCDYTGGNCWPSVKTTAVGSYCVPDAASAAAASQLNSTGVSVSDFSKAMSDVGKAQGPILGFGFGVAVFMGFVILRLLRVPAILSLLVWGMILGVGVALGLTGVFMITQAGKEEEANKPASSVDALKGVGYFFFALTAIYGLLILYLRNRIKLAIGVVKEAARAVGSTPALIFMPVLQTLGLLLFMLPWVYYGMYLASSGELVNYGSYRAFVYSANMRWAMLYHLFVFFWTSQFIVAVGQLVVALSVSSWYFTREKKVSNGPFLKALRLTVRYHLGTAAYGALIIAVIETLRAVLAYIQRKAAKASEGSVLQKVVQVVLCCLQCCLWCMKKCMQFINKNAYIQTAIFGTSFCTSARKAFFLILRNVARVAAVSAVGSFVLFVFKMLTAFGTAFVAYLYFSTQMTELNGYIVVSLIVLVIAYCVSLVFAEVLGMAISTVLQCFIADEEMCEGSFAEKDLKKWIDAHGSSKKTSQVEPEG